MGKRGVAIINVLVIFGLILAGVSGAEVLQHTAAVQEHEPTTATIVASGVTDQTDSDGDTEYRPAITYQYTVDGETYEHDNVFPGEFTRWSGNEAWAQNWAGEYQEGQEVTIYYDPGNPSSAYLVNDGLPTGWLLLAGVSVFFGVLALWLIVTGFRKRWTRSLVKDTPIEPVNALSIGPSAVSGTVVPGAKTVETPTDEEGTALAVYEVEDYHEGGEGSSGDVYTVDQCVAFEPFMIDDGSGLVRVEPDREASYDFDDDAFTRVHTGDRSTAPESLQRHFTDHRESWKSKLSGPFKTSRHYDVNTLKHGDEVYVFGSVDQRTDVDADTRSERRVIRTIDGGLVGEPMFMFSDREPQSLVDTRRWVLWRLPYGAGLLVCSFVIALVLVAPALGIDIPVLF